MCLVRDVQDTHPATVSRRGDRRDSYMRQRAAWLELHPWCEIVWDSRCEIASTEIDHWIDRSVRPDLVDVPANWRATCRPCHIMKSEHVREAFERGLKGHSWDEP